MLKEIFPLVLALAVAVTQAACEKKKTSAELGQEREAAWRAGQKAKAAKYYQELVEKFPDSEFAGQAKERLQAIGPVATPKAAAKH